jgi:hypothetical protein
MDWESSYSYSSSSYQPEGLRAFLRKGPLHASDSMRCLDGWVVVVVKVLDEEDVGAGEGFVV